MCRSEIPLFHVIAVTYYYSAFVLLLAPRFLCDKAAMLGSALDDRTCTTTSRKLFELCKIMAVREENEVQ